MKSFMQEFNAAARQSPRLYFAPLIGAYRAIRQEMRRAFNPPAEPKAPPAATHSRH